MIQFLVYVVIILAVVAIAQLVRVFELASELKGESTNEVTEKDNRAQAKMWMVFMVAFFAFCFWQVIKYSDKLLPVAGSEAGVGLDWLMNFNFIIISIVFVITNIFLFYFAYKYYGRKKGNTATFYPHNNKLEMIWTIIPAIVLAIIIVLGLRSWNNIMQPASPDAMVVELYAKQFDWTARYAGKNNILGPSSYKLITGTNALGMDSIDPGLDDIIVKNEIHLPVNKEVEFKFRSRDVIHSAYFPHFRAQMNCVPGMTTMFHFTPNVTTAEMRKMSDVIHQQNEINALRAKQGLAPEEFNYILLCNKICGASHYNMQMTIVVDTPEDYEKWIASKKPFFGGSVAPKAEAEKPVVSEEKIVAEK